MNNLLKKITDMLFKKEESPTIIIYAKNITIISSALLLLIGYFKVLPFALAMEMSRVFFGAFAFFFASDFYIRCMHNNGIKISDGAYVFSVILISLVHLFIALYPPFGEYKDIVGVVFGVISLMNVVIATKIFSSLSSK